MPGIDFISSLLGIVCMTGTTLYTGLILPTPNRLPIFQVTEFYRAILLIAKLESISFLVETRELRRARDIGSYSGTIESSTHRIRLPLSPELLVDLSYGHRYSQE
jgi:hypothetical protein